jgi:type IV pilus assembly protein PilV
MIHGNGVTGAVESREGGFTLLELLVAISILSVGLIASAAMLSTGMVSDRFAQRVTTETALAYSVMDEFLARAANDPIFDSDNASVAYDLDVDSAYPTRSVGGITYSATYTIDANAPVPGVTTVDITVSAGGRSITITSLKGTS